jgi:hypothetical protein
MTPLDPSSDSETPSEYSAKRVVRGKSLDAILITQSGKPREQPLGIVTVFDIPKLLAAVDPRRQRESARRR